MGCAYSNLNGQLPVSSPKIVPISSFLPPEKAGSFKVRILETIKKMDPILFEKILLQYKPKLSELTQNFDSKKTLLHHIAENNFYDGMTLAIDYILQKDPNKLANIVNALDADGNTPAMSCCISNAPETLEVIIKHELLDANSKNCENKNALDLAFENSLPCVNLLTVTTTSNTKTTSKFFLGSSVELLSPRPRASSISAVSADRRNSRKPSRFFSINESRELTSPLTTVMSLTKETSQKLAPNTKLYSILNGFKDRDAEQNLFIDDEFPHNTFSILGETSLSLFPSESKPIKWQRPIEFLNTDLKKIKIFEGIDLNLVSMSELAGSDLYSALGIMTEFPQRLLNTFTIKEVNRHGAYSVKFLISGIPIEIVLDDHFPCYDEKTLLFSKPVTNELWFLLLEKAFAKLYGSYEEVKNVDISDALELMTGMPSYQHDIKGTEEEDLWDIMQTYDRKNYIYCAGKYREGEGKGNRIFSIVNLYENDQYKIIKLRDHFQDFLWDGMFSEKSKNWTKELREETGYIKGERSCVYMELSEFFKHFDFLSVCHYHEGWIRNRVDVTTGPSTAALFEITLDQEMDLFISVHQKLPRYVTESPEYDISPVEILLIEKTEEGGLKKLTAGEKEAFIGKQTTYANRDIKIRLSEGKYLVRTKVRWVDNKPHEFTMSTFSSHDLTLRQVKVDEYPNLLERVYLDCGARVRDRYQLKNECEFMSAWCGSHLWIYAANKGNKLWTLEIDFETLINLRIPKKYLSGSNAVRMVIPANNDRVIYLKRINTDIVSVDWKLKHDWR